MIHPEFHALARELESRAVRYVLIGVGGANYFAQSASYKFNTRDRDLFLPPEHLPTRTSSTITR